MIIVFFIIVFTIFSTDFMNELDVIILFPLKYLED